MTQAIAGRAIVDVTITDIVKTILDKVNAISVPDPGRDRQAFAQARWETVMAFIRNRRGSKKVPA
ncbi:MAG: hypothetical protein QM682_00375 [Paracoccus sp. (in: a-proteobacteria)]|uniref:hypothetical protein n=1 Tax=Paracoccus sp. TaxID=267 RepID=UPI0039E22DD8